jgi:hypothetical protein
MYIPEENYSLVEDSMKTKFLSQRKPRPHEIINASLKDITDGVISICNLLNIQYRFAEQSIINSYNQFIIAETSAGEDVGTQSDDEDPKEPQEANDAKQEPTTVINNIDQSTTNNNDNSTTNNTTNNNISVNVNVDLSELKQLLKEIKTFTCKKLDSLLIKYNISKHGNKERKIEKLLNYINSMINDAQNLKDSCEKAKDT